MTKTTKRLTLLLFAALALLVPATSASAASWSLSFSPDLSTYVAPGDEFVYFVTPRNIGSTSTGAGAENALRVTVQLPPGLTATAADGIYANTFELWECEGVGTSEVTCTYPLTEVAPGQETFVPIRIAAVLDSTASPGSLPPATAVIAGGGGEGGANVPTLPDETTPCGYSGSPTPYQPPCASASSKPIQIDSAPKFGILDFDGRVAANQAGDPFTQAGGHPYAASTDIAFNTYSHPRRGPSWPVEPVKDVLVDLPPGLVGYLADSAQCDLAEIAPTPPQVEGTCVPESQVGTSTIVVSYGDGTQPAGDADIALYNLVPPPNVPARFGMAVFGVVVVFDVEVRSDGDYGVAVSVRNISEGLALIRSNVTIWGFPADPAHDAQRKCPVTGELGCTSTADPEEPLLRNPTSCTPDGVGLASTARADSWFNPGTYEPDRSADLSDPNWKSRTFLSHDPPGFPLPESAWGPEQGTTGCDQVPFDPQASIKPTTTQADSPTGLEVDLSIPQDLGGPDAIAQSDLKKAVVTLPEGMTVNPASADGLGACSLAQVDLDGRNTQANCPPSAKIGTVQIESPLLEESLEGTVYLAAQKDNPFGSLLALYIVAEARGQVVKLAGRVDPTGSGRLVTTFDNQPQLPFSNLHLVLKGGPRAPLINPPSCGLHSAAAALSPWSGNAPVELTSSFTLTSGPGGGPCPSGAFDPHLSAGTASPLAAAYSPFVLRLSREDGTRQLSGVSATLPKGLVGKLAGIPYCPEAALGAVSEAQGTAAAQIASPSCPAASQVGRVTVGAGAGPSPFYLATGRAYLAGPYKGAPLSLAIVTPAQAGPFDLGSVLVRSALRVDSESAQITAVSDPLPSLLHGIALDLRDVRVEIDRPSFTLNPTNCEPMSIEAAISGTGGAFANRSQPFQVANCADLRFGPRLSLSLTGGTKRSDHPALKAVLRAKPGQANIARTSVALPHSEFLAQSHIKTICTRVQFAAEACPKGSIYGYARAITPLLDKPLEGPVYLRSSSHSLPDLVAALGGQIDVDLVGRIDSVKGGIRTTFESVPDAPVTKFVLSMKGGKKGLLENSRNLCKSVHRATVLMDGQNGRTADSRPVLASGCGKARKRGAKKGR